jgi:hypothetical protein
MSSILLAGSQVAAAGLIASVWQGFLLAAIVWIGLKLAPKTTAGIRFLLWAVVFSLVAFMPLLSQRAVFSPDIHPYGVTTAPLLQLDSRWALALAGFWFAASMTRAIGLLRNGLRLRQLWKGSTPVEGGAGIQAALSTVRFRRAELCSSPEIDQPCVLGFFAPRILVPEWLLRTTSAGDLEQIVMHEVAHLQRGDDWSNLLQKVMLVLFPLNPALLWIEKQMCSEREMACDERVVLITKAPRDYAACLVNLAGRRLQERQAKALAASLSLGAWERRPELAGRVHTILRGGGSLDPWKARTVLATLMLATLCGAVELGKSSQLVGFEDASQEAFTVTPAKMPSTPARTNAYHDVVFHEPVQVAPLVFKSAVPHKSHPAVLRAVGGKLQNKKALPVERSATDSLAGQTLIMVTQWNTAVGSSTTITFIQTGFRFAVDPAARTSSGWYSFQL